MRMMKLKALALTLSAIAGLAATAAVRAGDLLVTGAKPDRLYVIDAEKRAVRSEFRIPGANGIVGAIVPSPDGKVAYVVVNKMESISGIDLKTGKEVFRADLSTPGERVKNFFALDVTSDGKELVVYELPTLLSRASTRSRSLASRCSRPMAACMPRLRAATRHRDACT